MGIKRKLFNRLDQFYGSINRKLFSSPFKHDGNRSIAIWNKQEFLSNPSYMVLLSEYRANGNFTGLLGPLSTEDETMVHRIKDNLSHLQDYQKNNKTHFGEMWDEFGQRMLSNSLQADPRLFNHVGALLYKTFSPWHIPFDHAIEDVLRCLVLYNYLSPRFENFDEIFTNLNYPFFHYKSQKINTNLRYYEEFLKIKDVLSEIKEKNPTPTVLEIGGGAGQLAQILISQGVKYCCIDLPGMQTRAPYSIYKNAKGRTVRIGFYKDYLDRGKNIQNVFQDFDVLYLPPWEKDQVKFNFDLALNVRSLSEMAESEMRGYLSLIKNQCHYLFSVNTNARDLDEKVQAREHDYLAMSRELDFTLLSTGTLVADTFLYRTLHHVYGIWKNPKF